MKQKNFKLRGIMISIVFIYIVFTGNFLGAEKNPEKFDIIVQKGHNISIFTMAISPDNKYALTGSYDGLIVLWDMATGKEIRSFKEALGDKESMDVINFTPDGKHILIQNSKHMRLVDFITWKEIYSIKNANDDSFFHQRATAFTTDGRNFLTENAYDTISFYETNTGKKKWNVPHGQRFIEEMAVSPDGKFGKSAGFDNTIKLWDLSDGKLISTKKGGDHNKNPLQYFYKISILSPDEKHFAADDGNGVVHSKVIQKLDGRINQLHMYTLSKDGSYLITAQRDGSSISDEATTLKLWNFTTGAEIKTFTRLPLKIQSLEFSPDGRYILANYGKILDYSPDNNRNTVIWEVATGKIKWNFYTDTVCLGGSNNRPRPDSKVYAFSPDSRYVLALLENDGQDLNNTFSIIAFIDIETGQIAKKIYLNADRKIEDIRISSDGKKIVTVGQWGTITVWDISSEELVEFKKLKNYKKAQYKYDFITKAETIRSMTGSYGTTSAVMLPDGKSVVSFGIGPYISKNNIQLWNYLKGSGNNEATIKGGLFDEPRIFFNKLAVSPAGRYVAVGLKKSLTLYDLPEEKMAKVFEGSESTTSNAFSRDGKLIISGDRDNSVKIWDVDTGKEVKSLKGHLNEVTAVALSHDGRIAASGSLDATIKLWDVRTGHCIYSSIANQLDMNIHKSEEFSWITYTDDGYWDASPRGGNLVAMVRKPSPVSRDFTAYNIDQFAVKNNRPDIISQRAGADQDTVGHFLGQYQKRLKKLGLTERDMASEMQVPEAVILESKQGDKFVDLKFRFSDRNYRLKSYNIYVNDVPLFGAYGKPLNGNSSALSEKIELTSGENKIEVSCMNIKGTESYRAAAYMKYDKPVKGDLYYIGFGVSRYKDDKLNLKYAHKDSKDLAEIFSKMKEGEYYKDKYIYKNVYTHTFTDDECTVAGIKKAKELLKNARADDTLVLFIAGHGIHDRDRDATYYYVTHETDLNNLKGTAANFDLIEDILQGIAPRKKLFLMDTCESGEIDENVQARGLEMARSRGFQARAIDKRGLAVTGKKSAPHRAYLHDRDRYIYNDLARRSGAIVFSSSRGGEFSYESDSVGNGFFTYQIKNALAGKAETKDRVVSVDSLKKFVIQEVPKLTEGNQNPTVDRDNIYQKFGFPAVY